MKIALGLTTAGEEMYVAVQENGLSSFRYFQIISPPYQLPPLIGDEVKIEKILPLRPPCLICIGLNYLDYALAAGATKPVYPVIVPKSIASVQTHEGPICLPRHLRSEKVDYEGELAVVLGKDCKNASLANALDFVWGYTCGNDVSARDWQFEFGGGQWARGKQFDTFAPLGPWIITRDEIPDPAALEITTTVNGEIRQKSGTHRMIFSVPELIVFLSASSTLPAGTVILTGTPTGVGMNRKPPEWLKPGDQITVSITHIGSLHNTVMEEKI